MCSASEQKRWCCQKLSLSRGPFGFENIFIRRCTAVVSRWFGSRGEGTLSVNQLWRFSFLRGARQTMGYASGLFYFKLDRRVKKKCAKSVWVPHPQRCVEGSHLTQQYELLCRTGLGLTSHMPQPKPANSRSKSRANDFSAVFLSYEQVLRMFCKRDGCGHICVGGSCVGTTGAASADARTDAPKQKQRNHAIMSKFGTRRFM